MKIIHVIQSIDSEASGPTYVVKRLCESQINLGFESIIYTLSRKKTNEYKNVVTFNYSKIIFPKFGFSFSLAYNLLLTIHKYRNEDLLVHNHGMWMFPNLIVGFYRLFYSFKHVVSPHGTLTDYAFSIGRSKYKWFFWRFVQKSLIFRSDALHVTDYSEIENDKMVGYKGLVFSVPWGIEKPTLVSSNKLEPKILLYLGRIHPNKGIDKVIDSWNSLGTETSGWELHIVGSHTGIHDNEIQYYNQLKRLSQSNLLNNIKFIGPKYGKQKYEYFAKSTFSILMSDSENFGVTVLESLICGTPVISSKNAPWSGLKINNCGYWIDNSSIELQSTLKFILEMDEIEYQILVNNSTRWANSAFNWKTISGDFIENYKLLFR